MQDFLIFYAPFLVLIGSVIFGFWFALRDGVVSKDRE
ncbi:cytochrome bd oxidase small subunit CydS [Metaplanococcus flavidus]|uniref:Uncharacterized protein n=1 Tax=Metaplanococcus flavidus TaxID=569883 RepID=A0ABW3LBX9_9BACL